MSDVNLAVEAPLNTDAPMYTPVPGINYRGQKGNMFDVGADVNINPANNQQSKSGTNVVAATTQAQTLATDFANGQTIDGVVLATGNYVLVMNQANPAENGVYTVAASGAPARTTGWTNGVGLQAFWQTAYVTGGATNKGKYFVQTNNILAPFILVGTTPLAFAEDSNQMVNQRNILAATATALTRQNAKPLTSQPYGREERRRHYLRQRYLGKLLWPVSCSGSHHGSLGSQHLFRRRFNGFWKWCFGRNRWICPAGWGSYPGEERSSIPDFHIRRGSGFGGVCR